MSTTLIFDDIYTFRLSDSGTRWFHSNEKWKNVCDGTVRFIRGRLFYACHGYVGGHFDHGHRRVIWWAPVDGERGYEGAQKFKGSL